ncbi:ATP-binding cassette domain-containing protein [Streptomyces sp. ACA25]|uniref:ATP-binding cassette domain-containing protein n=1 Tax=Streptomyces sp. ACA25 TaxID=3022596 RepID=UPI0023071220|nr:ATP-binding cassette domain-containing protein [Streptomyces sp. ACA25]MDB1089554.1 ATP-binding cassette domain-containing protein [Streptomyces sp. ACA25]
MAAAIVAEGLVKRFGAVTALDGLSLTVEEGSVMGLLGPNGAGKTTTVRVLATLLQPDQGRATVDGLDVSADARALRTRIGLSGQYAAVDEDLTARENLTMVGRLYHLGRRRAQARTDELLEQFDLAEAANRPVKGYSGGMRRRVDLACALVAKPSVLFLDEPTTGLDPRSRITMWKVITDLVAQGSTLLLTTQYLEEADQLADRIAVIDHGRVIAEGTPDRLKEQVGGERLQFTLGPDAPLDAARSALAPLAAGDITVEEGSRRISVPVTDGAEALLAGVRCLDGAAVRVVDVQLRRPTLDEVFLALTGTDAPPPEDSALPAAEARPETAAQDQRTKETVA